MKKFLSIMLCILMLGSFIFAQEESVLADGLKVKAKGSAKLTWGIDLGKGTKKEFGEPAYPTHGFYNQTNLKLYIPFFGDEQALAGGSTNKEADVYADVKFNVTPGDMFVHKHDVDGKETKKDGFADTAPGYDVSAKLVFYGAYIKVFGAPNFASNYAIGWKPIRTDDWDDNRRGDENWFKPQFKGWGGKIGYANKDMMDIDTGLKFGSNRSWHRKDDKKYFADNKEQKEDKLESLYALGFDFHMMPVEKYLTIDATVNSTFHSPKRYAVGVNPAGRLGGKNGKNVITNFGLKLGSEPIDKLKIGLGFDGVTGLQYINKNSNYADIFGWDLGFTVAYNWVDLGLYVCGVGTDKKGYDLSSNDLTKYWNDGTNMAMHFGFKSEESGDTNFVEGLAFHTTLNVYDLLAKRNNVKLDDTEKKDLLSNVNRIGEFSHFKSIGGIVPLGLNVGLSYKASITDSMWLKPFFEFYGETNHYKKATDKDLSKLYFGIAYEVGVTFSPVEKAELTAKWVHGKLNDNNYEGGWGGEYMIEEPVQHKNHNGTFTLGLELKF